MGEVSTPRRRIAVTGASGFIGRETVARAAASGHTVVAVIRPETDGSRAQALKRLGVEIAACGLADPVLLGDALHGCDAVIHLAVSSARDDRRAVAETIEATRSLLGAMKRAAVRRFVHASSFAVYDYESIPTHSLVDESSPVISADRARDWYSRVKVAEEHLVQTAVRTGQIDAVVLRLGAVLGPGRLWTGRIGARAGRLWLCIGSGAEVPVLTVASAADCLVRAATIEQPLSSPLNVLEQVSPTQRTLRRQLAERTLPRPISVVIPWWCARWIGGVLWAVTARASALQRRVPAILRPPTQAARFKPFRFSNAACQRALAWSSSGSLAEYLDSAELGGEVRPQQQPHTVEVSV